MRASETRVPGSSFPRLAGAARSKARHLCWQRSRTPGEEFGRSHPVIRRLQANVCHAVLTAYDSGNITGKGTLDGSLLAGSGPMPTSSWASGTPRSCASTPRPTPSSECWTSSTIRPAAGFRPGRSRLREHRRGLRVPWRLGAEHRRGDQLAVLVGRDVRRLRHRCRARRAAGDGDREAAASGRGWILLVVGHGISFSCRELLVWLCGQPCRPRRSSCDVAP